jgi:hypothetical protein
MAQHKTLLCAIAFFGGVSYLLGACGGGDESHPKNLDSGAGSGGGGGTGGDSSLGGGGGSGGVGNFGPKDGGPETGTGGKPDSGPDAPIDAAHCTNGTKDVDESDEDCGGTACDGCDVGKDCGDDGDCASLKCNASTKVCSAPLCTDQVQNGNETDKDCGGSCSQKCADAKKCLVGSDCASLVCNPTTLTCSAPSCTDTVKNGTEGDVDCGGPCTTKCGLGLDCKNNADCSSNVCQTNTCKCPTGMILVAAVGGGSYCIDQYEVTYEQYAIFWGGNPITQGPECTWNTNFTPSNNWPADVGEVKYPVRNVDWCDAFAYCKSVGKRMCGKQTGGAVAFSSFDDYTVSQWTNACTAGTNTYPYSGPFDANRCMSALYSGPPGDAGIYKPTSPLPGTRNGSGGLPFQNCQGASPGLYDMSGNAAEWDDSCDAATGASDNCHVRGGSYSTNTQADLQCNATLVLARNATPEDVGIRCCYP